MATWTQDDATCHVFAYKEGLLAAVGHDVKLAVGRFSLTAEDAADGSGSRQVHGTFDPASLVVVCAMERGEERPGTLSDGDRDTIEGYVRDDILRVADHPEIVWQTTRLAKDGDGWRVEGRLTLHGRTKTVRAKITRDDDRYVTRVRIRQPEFGIAPFRALMGALKIKAVVEVELSIPATLVL